VGVAGPFFFWSAGVLLVFGVRGVGRVVCSSFLTAVVLDPRKPFRLLRFLLPTGFTFEAQVPPPPPLFPQTKKKN